MPKAPNRYTYADLFAGCGGLSLGLINAGWKGYFAIEKNASAFGTLKLNLLDGQLRGFSWPEWLPKTAMSTSDLLNGYIDKLKAMRGQVTLLAGSPPCQGFSMAGRRTHADPRNSLTEEYILIVKELQPRILLIENVLGFTLPFKKHGDEEGRSVPYSTRVTERIEALGYRVFSKLLNLSDYGIPQARNRFIIIAILNDDPACNKLYGKTPFDLLDEQKELFLSSKGLPIGRPVTIKEAIDDLRVSGKELIDSTDSCVKGFKQIHYKETTNLSAFVKLMRKGTNKAPDSLRLPKHKPETINKFKKIISTCTQGRTLSDLDRKRIGIKKQALTPLKASLPSATITTLPDDMIHYSEPRILTVRENARIQTFPDWFQFTGQYTTGGKDRKNKCPRYTQVGNAVPPLFAEAIGRVLKELAS